MITSATAPEKIIINPDAQMAWSADNGPINLAARDRETQPKQNETYTALNRKFAMWGNDNRHPQKVIEDIESNALLSSKLRFLAKARYGGGIAYRHKKGGEILPETEDGIEELLFRSSSHSGEALIDNEIFEIIFTEMVKDARTGKVKFLSRLDTSFCRYGKRNKAGVISTVYYNANIVNNSNFDDTYLQDLPHIEKRDLEFKFSTRGVYVSGYPTIGSNYYPTAAWNPVRSTWLPYANSIVKTKKAIMDNGISPKFLIEVPYDYWPWRFPKWDTYTPEEKKKARKDVLNEFTTAFKGGEKSGGTMMTTFRTDPHGHKEYGRWKITAIDNSTLDGFMKSDSFEANSHIISALNLDASLAGLIPGTSSAGAGSKDRNAFNILMALSFMDHANVLEPYYWAIRYNKLPQAKDIEFYFKNLWISTLDTVSPSDRDVNGNTSTTQNPSENATENNS